MRRLSVVLVCVCLVSGFASATTFTGVGNWSDPNLWSAGVPIGAVQADIGGPNTVCTLNTSTGDWGSSQRMTVDGGATLLIQDGAEMLGGGWVRVGVSGIGNAIQTGGLVRIANDKLGIGDKVGGVGYYTMLGGTLTYDGDRGDLAPGSRDGVGTFTVVGTAPVIQMGNLIVSERGVAAGTVEFKIDANGVSPINLTGQAKIDVPGAATTSSLIVSATDAPPMRDIVLVNTTSDNAVLGAFDTVNGKPGVEGAQVVLSANGLSVTYSLTYVGGTGNDIVLVYQSSVKKPTVIYVTSVKDNNQDGVQDDISWKDWLEGEGYKVDFRPGYWSDPLDANEIAELDAADLVLASRGMATGDFDGAETPKWNGLTTPILCTNAWMIRNNRWKWMNSGSANKDADSPPMLVTQPDHPIFAGLPLDEDGLIEILDPNAGSGNTSFLTDFLDPGNGALLSESLGVYTTAWIVEWQPGVEYYAGAGEIAGGPRMLFMAGTQDDPYTDANGNIMPVGVFNLNENGQQLLRHMIGYLAPDKPISEGL
jgi:hypothetical protein